MASAGVFTYTRTMNQTVRQQPDPVPDDDEAAEIAALSVAVEKARANKRGIPHEEMRAWLLEIAAGDFDAPPPFARDP